MPRQLFRDTEFNEKFDRWTGLVKGIQGAYAWRMFDQFTSSKQFGYFIWDNELSDLAEYFSRDYFAENWTSILLAFEIAGTFESYILIIQSALGGDTVINFASPAPSHLQINITTPTGLSQFSAYHDDDFADVIPEQTANPDSTLVFQTNIAPLTGNETIKLIELLNVNGVFVEVNFV